MAQQPAGAERRDPDDLIGDDPEGRRLRDNQLRSARHGRGNRADQRPRAALPVAVVCVVVYQAAARVVTNGQRPTWAWRRPESAYACSGGSAWASGPEPSRHRPHNTVGSASPAGWPRGGGCRAVKSRNGRGPRRAPGESESLWCSIALSPGGVTLVRPYLLSNYYYLSGYP